MPLTLYQTQKTVCKHLLEDPYLYQVVDDPIYASMVSVLSIVYPLAIITTNSRDSESQIIDVSIRAKRTPLSKVVGLWVLKAMAKAIH